MADPDGIFVGIAGNHDFRVFSQYSLHRHTGQKQYGSCHKPRYISVLYYSPGNAAFDFAFCAAIYPALMTSFGRSEAFWALPVALPLALMASSERFCAFWALPVALPLALMA